MERIRCREGVIALEASIVLTLFMFLILLLYSFISFFQVTGMTQYAVLKTVASMSLDPYEMEALQGSGSVNELLTTYGLEQSNAGNGFVSNDKWYEKNESGDYEENSEFFRCLKQRYIAYLTSGGTNSDADQMLKSARVLDGIEGINFSESKIENGDLYVTIKYKIKLLFNYEPFGIGDITVKQSSCSSIWGL